jgi:hypothetical protein
MVVAGRRRSIAFFIALGIGLISVIVLLYIGWVLRRSAPYGHGLGLGAGDWRPGIV